MSQVLHKLKEAAKARWSELVHEAPAAGHADRATESSVQLVPIASGKGGVGKTNIAVNLSIAAGLRFASTPRRVLLIDGDLGLPNTDLVLGVRPERSLADIVEKTESDIEQLVCRTRYPAVDFIAGAEEATLVLGNLYYQQRRNLISKISRLHSSLVIFDLGASASKEILDFFAMAPSGIVVLNPEPTSIRDGYVFIKNALIRRIRHELEPEAEARGQFDALLEESGGSWQRLAAAMPQKGSARLREIWRTVQETYRPMIVVNRAESLSEGLNTARKFTHDVEKLLGLHILYMGSVLKDDAVSRAVKAQRPFRIAEPGCPASRCIDAITNNLLKHDGLDLNRNFVSLGRILTARLVGQPI